MLTITLNIQDKSMDIMVKENQRMSDVLQILKDNGRLFYRIEKIVVYSTRKKEYINKLLTFKQAGIFTGDILVLK